MTAALLTRIGAVLLVAAAAGLQLASSIERAAPRATEAGVAVTWEAESAESVPAPHEILRDPEASEGRFLQLNPGERRLHYEVWIEQPGRYTLWTRAKWVDGCADSVLITLNGGRSSVIGNDAIYGSWHWVKGGRFALRRGRNTLAIDDLFQPVQVDRFALTSAAGDAPPEPDARSGARIALSDDFLGDWQQRWTPADARWETRDRSAQAFVAPTGEARSLLLAGRPDWRDYRFEAALRAPTRGAAGLAFHADAGAYTVARLVARDGRSVLELARVEDSAERVLASREIAAPAGDWLRLAIASRGEDVRVSVDGVERLAAASGAAQGRVALYSEGERAAFDDVEIRSIGPDAAPAATPLPVRVIDHAFDDASELNRFVESLGPWWIQDGALRSIGVGGAAVAHRRTLSGAFTVQLEARIERGETLALQFLAAGDDPSVSWQRDADGLRVAISSGDQQIAEKRLPDPGDAALALSVRRDPHRIAVALAGAPLLAADVPDARGAVRLGLEAAVGSAELESLRVAQVPEYEYSPWRAPVGWFATEGRLELGHVFLSGRGPGGAALLWNRGAFPCAGAWFETALAIRSDAPPGASVDLLLCNDGTRDVNGLALRFELMGESSPFVFKPKRRARLSLRHREKALGTAELSLPVNPSGFVALLVAAHAQGRQLVVEANHREVLRERVPDFAGAGTLGLRFAAGSASARDTLGVASLRVFR